MRIHLILYVRDQALSTAFYRRALGREPDLNVPGMTEFHLGTAVVLGLMPERGIERLLGLEPTKSRPSRAEIYLCVDDPAELHARALDAGAIELSPLAPRDWGDTVAYSRDPDGHVLAFAKPSSATTG